MYKLQTKKPGEQRWAHDSLVRDCYLHRITVKLQLTGVLFNFQILRELIAITFL